MVFLMMIWFSSNVTIGETEDRMMMTGKHTVADIFCVSCGSIVGWRYVSKNMWHCKKKHYMFLCGYNFLWLCIVLPGDCSWEKPEVQRRKVSSWKVIFITFHDFNFKNMIVFFLIIKNIVVTDLRYRVLMGATTGWVAMEGI